MPTRSTSADQQFLNDLDKKLWNAADRLRSNLDDAVYKHAVLGLIFLKYVSDAFDSQIEAKIANNRIQSRTLATLRDTLLPTLLSGELSVATVSAKGAATL